ncbi:MAG: sodium/hydrogen antiporter [Porticoccaceae bacterium]|nr:MAG: sodium/hydrogen antiporter [Porticoccaceae bacterium]
MDADVSLTVALVLMVGMVCQWVSWRLKQPSILFLLLAGIVAGPVTGWLAPDAIFGSLLFPMVSLGVALVLFEGALTLRLSDLRGHGPVVSHLVTWGALLNWLLIAAGTRWVLDLPWEIALLFGALVVVTGPTVIIPLLRTVKPRQNLANILRWEGILIDPIGALLAVLVFEVIIAGGSHHFWSFLARELAVGAGCGVAGALLLGQLLRRHWLPEYLHNVFTLGLVLTVFAVSNHFAHESGLLAVTVMGVWLANTPGLYMEEILSFKESLSVLVISALFIVLAARVDLGQLLELGWLAPLVIGVILLARAAMVYASTLGSGLGLADKALLSWIAPRGIVAAAVSALFAFRLEALGYEQASLLTALTFFVILVTVLLQSLTAAPLAALLGLRAEDRGVLIVGGNPVAIAVGRALKENGYRVKIATPNWSEAQEARMAGLEVYFGNPVSAHADQHLDLVGFGMLLAMSRRPALNALAAYRYQAEFGKGRVFTLRSAEEQDSSEKHRLVEPLRSPRLFGGEITIQKLSSMLARDWEIRTTKLTREFTLEDFERRYDGRAIKLFAISPQGRLWVYSDAARPAPKEGWKLVFVAPKAPVQKKVDEADERAAATAHPARLP